MDSPTRFEAAVRTWLILLLLCIPATPQFAFCQSNENIPVPEYYGIYAVDGGKLVKLDSQQVHTGTVSIRLGQRAAVANILQGQPVATSTIAEVAKFAPDLKIIVFSQPSGLESPLDVAKSLHLESLVFIRNLSVDTGWPSNVRRSGAENGWESGDAPELLGMAGGDRAKLLEFLVKPMPGRQDMVVAAPSEHLRPGVYRLAAGSEDPLFRSGRNSGFLFAVEPITDGETSSCVDAVVTYAMAMSNSKYTPCGGVPQATNTRGTQVPQGAVSPPGQPSTAGAETPAAPPAAAAPSVPPLAAGVVRIGVVKIKDMSGQSLPTDNLRLDLMSEFARQQLDPVPLDAEAPQQEVESEARSKQCDYFVYTVATQVTEPGSAGLSPSSLPKGVKLDPAKFQALSGVTLYKVGKPLPEIKDLRLSADAARFNVDAVMATFVQESDKVAQQVAEDAHPTAGTKAPAKPAAKTAKPH